MARKRINRLVPGEHLVVTHDGDVRHSDQVTIGLYGAQRGRIIDIDDLDGPDVDETRRQSQERMQGYSPQPLRSPITGPED